MRLLYAARGKSRIRILRAGSAKRARKHKARLGQYGWECELYMLFAYKGKHYCFFYFLFKFERKHTICIFIESPADIPSRTDAARPRETLILSLGQSGLQLLGTSGRRARVAAPHPGGHRAPELRLSLPLARLYPPDTSGSAPKLKPRQDGCLRRPIISISLARGSSRPAAPPRVFSFLIISAKSKA